MDQTVILRGECDLVSSSTILSKSTKMHTDSVLVCFLQKSQQTT